MRRCSWMIMAACALASSGCFEDYDLPYNTGSLGGYVMISGPVRGARVTIDQLDAHTGTVYQHIGDDTTDERGHFLIPETRQANGLFLMVARGGTFEDLATGATIQLDEIDELRSLLLFPILADRDDGLVSPIGHLIEAWAWAKLPELGDMTAAVDDATAHLAKHFGQATQWGLQKLHDLGTPATSPTEPVRTAFVHAALSYLAHDIAIAAGASAQQINVYTLLQRWTADLVREGMVDPAGFDGNDGNDATFDSGLQLGYCEPLAPCADPPTGCRTGYCRVPCDLYSNTPRALLAGAITKVIHDDTVNRTGLGIADLLQVARAVSDNADRSLFGDSCSEPLDRTRPVVRWDESATPASDAAVAGIIGLRAIGTDDVDLQPPTEILGYADQDGDTSNSVAIASIDTATVPDGDLTVSARAVDLAGNSSTITRHLIVDNTAPQLTMSSAGFFVDGITWWTASAAPVLTGTVVDATSVAVKAVIEGGIEVAGVVAGATWTIAIPPGVLDAGGTAVQIVAIDAAGNRSSLALRLRPDLEPPVLSFQTSTVNDEEGDWVTFAADHSPRHLHTGIPVDLATASGCPSLTKHSYLLGATSPEYTAELPGPNPLLYQLVTDDPGVGIAAGSTEYRIGRRAGLQTIWVQDWTSAGAGVPIATGVTRFPIGIFSDVVADLATTEGTYDVELRATDRLARTMTAARCFDLHLRAPPLEVENTASSSRPTKDHAYALDSLSLAPGAQYDQIAARLLNEGATGASLIDQDVFNGTTETIYLIVTVTKPYSVMVSQTFVLGNAHTNVTAASCGSSCNTPVQGEEFTSAPSAPQATTLYFPAKVFELVNGEPATEIPCLAPCPPSGTVFKFAIPPRSGGGQPARAFRVMTMIGQISELWPRDGVQHTEVAPFEDAAITWADDNGYETTTRLTGKLYYSNDPAYTGCVKFVTDPANPNGPPVCLLEGTVVPYLALRSAELTFTTDTRTRYETAATANLAPALAGPDTFRRTPANIWTTAEGTLP